MLRFCDELIARVTRAGADGVKLLRADSGFWNNKVFKRLETAGWQYSIGVPMRKAIRHTRPADRAVSAGQPFRETTSRSALRAWGRFVGLNLAWREVDVGPVGLPFVVAS
jgi:hypothetical protein